MAIGLINYPNITAPDSDYPSGRIKDDTGIDDGTPIDLLTNGDLQEFFAKLIRDQGITPNGAPDNEYSGNQTYQAFIDAINKNVGSDIILGLIGPYTPNDIIILWGIFTSPSVGLYALSHGAAYYNGIIYKFVSSVAPSSAYKFLQIDNSINPGVIQLATSGIAQYGDASIKYLPGVPTYYTATGVFSSVPPTQKNIVELGVWNMDTTASITINHNAPNRKNILSVTVLIFDDANFSSLNIEAINPNIAFPGGAGGTLTIQNSTLTLTRITGGLFDSTSYDDTTMNRGIAIIEYML